MALRQLVRFDDERFRKVSKAVVKFDERLWTLLDDMYETLKKVNGYGMAAVHVGVLRRAVLINDNGVKIELVNPTIMSESEDTQRVFEGSIAGGAPWGYVIRPMFVTVSAVDRNGEAVTTGASGFLAATLCHEIDHLDGVLFADKAEEIVNSY
ncbi:peptide deformylase [Clostridia bacterium]|nr:peptide deformylase [Clostridia bacterium]